jgi:hypothetical protein
MALVTGWLSSGMIVVSYGSVGWSPCALRWGRPEAIRSDGRHLEASASTCADRAYLNQRSPPSFGFLSVCDPYPSSCAVKTPRADLTRSSGRSRVQRTDGQTAPRPVPECPREGDDHQGSDTLLPRGHHGSHTEDARSRRPLLRLLARGASECAGRNQESARAQLRPDRAASAIAGCAAVNRFLRPGYPERPRHERRSGGSRGRCSDRSAARGRCRAGGGSSRGGRGRGRACRPR